MIDDFIRSVVALQQTPFAGVVLYDHIKTAAEVRPKTDTNIVGKLQQLQSGKDLSRSEVKQVRKQLQLLSPRTKTEKQVQELAGRPLTPGQIARYAVIGGTAGSLFGVGKRGISALIKKPTGTLKAIGTTLRSPAATGKAALGLASDVAGDVAQGAIYGGVLPVVRRASDIEAARRGKF